MAEDRTGKREEEEQVPREEKEPFAGAFSDCIDPVLLRRILEDSDRAFDVGPDEFRRLIAFLVFGHAQWLANRIAGKVPPPGDVRLN